MSFQLYKFRCIFVIIKKEDSYFLGFDVARYLCLDDEKYLMLSLKLFTIGSYQVILESDKVLSFNEDIFLVFFVLGQM